MFSKYSMNYRMIFLKFKFILLVDIKVFSRLITFIRIAVTRTNMIFYLEKDQIILITDIVHIYFNMMHTYLNLIFSLAAIDFPKISLSLNIANSSKYHFLNNARIIPQLLRNVIKNFDRDL